MFRRTVFIFTIIYAFTFNAAAQETTAPPKSNEPTAEKNLPPNQKKADAKNAAAKDADAPDTDDKKPDDPAAVTKTRYRLQPSDVLDVRYVYSPEYDRKGIIVQPDGYISLELVGNVRVAGKTIDEVRELIRKRAAERLNEPEVLVILTDFVKPYFVVAGEVPTPGRLDLRENTSALQAVMLAGGFKDSAKSSQIILFRRYNAEVVETRIINLKDLKRDSNLREDIMLESGDMIFVPRNTVTKLERYARLASVVSIFGFLIP